MDDEPATSDQFEIGPLGILRLKKRGVTVTSEMVHEMIDAADDKELQELSGRAIP